MSLLLVALAAGGLQLDWSAPGACPSRERVTRSVVELYGGDVSSVQLAVTATASGPPWTVRLSAASPGGVSRRSLRGESCEALAEAAAVIIAIALSAEAARAAEPVEARAAAASPPPRRPDPLEGRLTLAPVEVRWPIELEAEGAVGLVTGVVDAPSPQAQVGIALRGRHWSAAAGPWFRGPNRLEAGSQIVWLWGWGGYARGCGTFERPRWDIGVCGRVEVGAFEVSRSGSEPWVAAGGGLAGGLRFGRLRVGLHAELLAPQIRPRVRAPARNPGEPGDVVAQTRSASFRAFLSLSRVFR